MVIFGNEKSVECLLKRLACGFGVPEAILLRQVSKEVTQASVSFCQKHVEGEGCIAKL